MINVKSFFQKKKATEHWQHWYYRFWILLLVNTVPTLPMLVFLMVANSIRDGLLFFGSFLLLIALVQSFNPAVKLNSHLLQRYYQRMQQKPAWNRWYFRIGVMLIVEWPLWLICLGVFSYLKTVKSALIMTLFLLLLDVVMTYFEDAD